MMKGIKQKTDCIDTSTLLILLWMSTIASSTYLLLFLILFSCLCQAFVSSVLSSYAMYIHICANIKWEKRASSLCCASKTDYSAHKKPARMRKRRPVLIIVFLPYKLYNPFKSIIQFVTFRFFLSNESSFFCLNNSIKKVPNPTLINH